MSHRILVIDHNPTGLQRVVDPLREAGYEVAVAQTAADGASAFGRFAPELVFIAARLPRTHGTVLCRELKRTDAGTNTPIVLLVEGTGVQIDLPPLDQFGADRLIQKPVSIEELLVTCSDLLNPALSVAAGDGDVVESLPAAMDDGLNTALEELDSLEFDLPENSTGAPPDIPEPGHTAVPLPQDPGQDIENHLDDLFMGRSPEPAPPAEPTPVPIIEVPETAEPFTGHDNDADAAVHEELDLQSDLDSKLGGQGGSKRSEQPKRSAMPAAPAEITARPDLAPPLVSATATAQRHIPPAGSSPVTGRFQTEALTRTTSTPPEQTRPAAEPGSPLRLPRWSWVAVPVIVGLVAFAVFYFSRPQQPEAGFAATPLASGADDGVRTPDATSAGAGFSLPDDKTPIEPVLDAEDEPAPEAPSRQRAASQPPPAAPIEKPRPEPIKAKPQVRETPPPAITQAQPRPAPRPVEPEPEPVAPQQQAPPIEPEPQAPEPVTTTTEPEPQVPEPVVVEPPVEEHPAEPVIEPEPVSRDPILVRRVEPRVDAKALKKGGGTVVLRVRVSENGAVTRVLVDQGLPGSPLEAAAVAAVLRWRYEPALDRDSPIEAWTTARFQFGEDR